MKKIYLLKQFFYTFWQGLWYGVPVEFLNYVRVLTIYLKRKKDISVFLSYDLEVYFEAPSENDRIQLEKMLSKDKLCDIDIEYITTPTHAAFVLAKMIKFLRARNPILTKEFCNDMLKSKNCICILKFIQINMQRKKSLTKYYFIIFF